MISLNACCGVGLPFLSSVDPNEQIILSEEERLKIVKKKLSLSDATIEEHRKLFDNFDRDENGYLVNGEIKNALYFFNIAVTDGEIQHIIKEFDKDENGYIEFPEFVSIIATRMMDANKEIKYLQIFQRLDKNGNGFLSEAELMNGLEEISQEKDMLYYASLEDIDQKVLKKALTEVNRDGGGGFNYSDFVKALRSNGILP